MKKIGIVIAFLVMAIFIGWQVQSNAAVRADSPGAEVNRVTGECGLTTFTAKQIATKVVGNMYLVVDASGSVQTKHMPASGEEVNLNVGPFTNNTILRWRVFGGGERDYDLPIWTGYGTPTFKTDINAFAASVNSWSWTVNNDPNPFTNWYTTDVEGCSENGNGGIDPTPEPGPSRTSRMWLEKVACEDLRVRARVEVKNDDAGDEGVKVTFKYNGKEVVSRTGSDGRAGASFDYAGEGDLTADIESYSNKHLKVESLSCDAVGGVLGASTEGDVLGATTFAETGTVADTMMAVLGLEGVISTTVGALLYAKKRK